MISPSLCVPLLLILFSTFSRDILDLSGMYYSFIKLFLAPWWNTILLLHKTTQSPLYRDMDWSIDNSMILSGSSDGTVRLWNCEKGICIRVVTNNGPISAVRFQVIYCCREAGKLYHVAVFPTPVVFYSFWGTDNTCESSDAVSALYMVWTIQTNILFSANEQQCLRSRRWRWRAEGIQLEYWETTIR